MKKELPYQFLARYYDKLFEGDLKFFRRARRRLLGAWLRKAKSACDLACGPGNTAIELARRGLQVFAVDLSPQMCRITREKARGLGLEITVVEADMRDFRLPAPVDLVVCEFDAVNHVPRRADLAKVARSAARALRPGGGFYFDVNTLRAFEEIWPGVWYQEIEGIKLVINSGCDKRRKQGWSQFQWFVPEGGLYRLHSERYREVCWSDKEIEEALRGAGFDEIRRWDSTEVIPGPAWVRPGCRVFYLASRGAPAEAPRRRGRG